MKRTPFLFAFLFLLLGPPVFAQTPASKLYEVQVEKKPFFYIEVTESGEAFKAYPKPRVPLGKFAEDGDKLEFFPAESVHSEDTYYPLVANIVSPGSLEAAEMDLLKQLLFETKGAKLEIKKEKDALEPKTWTGPELKLDWKNVQAVKVDEETRKKIESFEKALLGKWKFVKATDSFGENKAPLQYRKIEFCADGKCIADGEDKFYWVDGRFERLSFQDKAEWQEYSMLEEYDISRPSENELVLHSIAATPLLPPSRHKLKEWEVTYPEHPLKWVFYFERVKE